MKQFEQQFVDCEGFEIIRGIPWGLAADDATSPDTWAFVICAVPDQPEPRQRYGAIASMQSAYIHESCLGIILDNAPDDETALAYFMLAYGLSITVEIGFGDALVVAGANPLSLSILTAASTAYIKTACLVSESESESSRLLGLERFASELIDFRLSAAFDSALKHFTANTQGQVAFVDTAGAAALIFAMTAHLAMFGSLTLCRQDIAARAPLDIYRDIHRKSTRLEYRSRPQNVSQVLTLRECYVRAVNLFKWGRLSDTVLGNLVAQQRLSPTASR